jgi:type II secretory pathway pseudopilin PulG
MQPINFKKERIKRENAAIERLKDIRKAQESYKDKYGKYTASFDTLIHFVNTDSFELSGFNIVGDWDPDEMTKQEAIKKGLIEKTIIKKSVRDSLFTPDFDIDQLRYIPYTDNKEFTMGAGEVETGSQVKVKVFEAYALYDDLFHGMDRQEVINYKDQRYKITQFEGVKVGSLTEANNNAGNWEK